MFVFLGDNSYVLYLFHWPILVVLRGIWNNWLFLLVAGMLVTVVATFVFEKWLKPMLGKFGGSRV